MDIDMKLTDEEILQELNDDGDNLNTELLLRDARIVESLVNQKTHIVWIKNIGRRPSCSKTLVCLSDGKFDIGDPLLYGWNLDFRPYITQYAIIEE